MTGRTSRCVAIGRRFRGLGLVACGLAASLAAGEARAQDLRGVPLDHWAYEVAEEIVLRHPDLAWEVWMDAKPWTEGDFESLVAKARETGADQGIVGAWVEALAAEFPVAEGPVPLSVIGRRPASDEVEIHNGVVAAGRASARKDDATFEPPFLGARFSEDAGEPAARAWVEHTAAIGRSDRWVLAGRWVADAEVRNDPTRWRVDDAASEGGAGVTLLDAYGTVKFARYVRLFAGRHGMRLGPGRASPVLVSDSIPAIDHAQVEVRGVPWRFTVLAGRLSSDLQNRSLDEDGETIPGSLPPEEEREEVTRWFYLHRLAWRPVPQLSLAVGEAVVASGVDRGFDPLYAQGFYPYFFAQRADDDQEDANIFVFAEGSYGFSNGVRVYGSVNADEYFVNTEEDLSEEIGDQLAWRLGGEWGGAFGVPSVTAGAEYTRVDVFTYLHRGLNTGYTTFGAPIGSTLGPDADQAQAWLTWWAGPRLRVTADALLRRDGERSVEALENEVEAGNPEFPSGVAQRELRAGLEAWAMWPERGLEGSLRLSARDVDDVAHEEGRGERFWRAAVEVRWRGELR